MAEVGYEEFAARGARTQSLFRGVNERVREINTAFGQLVPLGDWICECADSMCSERVELLIPEYEEVRSRPTRFLVAPDEAHVVEDIEEVVARSDRYWVVEKRGSAGELVAAVDPRRVGLRGQGDGTASQERNGEASRQR